MTALFNDSRDMQVRKSKDGGSEGGIGSSSDANSHSQREHNQTIKIVQAVEEVLNGGNAATQQSSNRPKEDFGQLGTAYLTVEKDKKGPGRVNNTLTDSEGTSFLLQHNSLASHPSKIISSADDTPPSHPSGNQSILPNDRASYYKLSDQRNLSPPPEHQ